MSPRPPSWITGPETGTAPFAEVFTSVFRLNSVPSALHDTIVGTAPWYGLLKFSESHYASEILNRVISMALGVSRLPSSETHRYQRLPRSKGVLAGNGCVSSNLISDSIFRKGSVKPRGLSVKSDDDPHTYARGFGFTPIIF